MKAILRSGFLALAVMLALAVPASSGPFEDGKAAYDRGEYATALKFFRPLAEQGDANALYNLGLMYYIGVEGVLQDYVSAHMWFNLAAAQGNNDAREKRQDVEQKIDANRVFKAQDLALEWWVRHQQSGGNEQNR